MLTLPAELMTIIVNFAPLFSKAVFEYAKVLLVGAILAPGKRTVTACLRVCGKSQEKHFQNYHRLLNRARWSALAGSRILLQLLLATFSPTGTLVFGIDDTIERRRGSKIAAKGIYRDPVRSSHSHFVKASGLRWLCCMLLTEIGWAGRIWALPFLTILCPSERFYKERKRRHQTLVERAWQLIQLLARWLPKRSLVFVADSSFAVLDLLKQVSALPNASLLTRLRLDAALYDAAPTRKVGQTGRPRLKGKRRRTLAVLLLDATTEWTKVKIENWYGKGEREIEICSETAVWYHCGKLPVEIRWLLIRDRKGEFQPQALLSTNIEHLPEEIVGWFMRRWQMEVTFEEGRRHLGIETQRQWNDLAIGRSTPALLGLFSVVTLVADSLQKEIKQWQRTAAWYRKKQATFADAMALVRGCLWNNCHFSTSSSEVEVIKIPRALFERLTDTLCYAA
jgi:hypothetical protein